jgi:hypothetical protein
LFVNEYGSSSLVKRKLAQGTEETLRGRQERRRCARAVLHVVTIVVRLPHEHVLAQHEAWRRHGRTTTFSFE